MSIEYIILNDKYQFAIHVNAHVSNSHSNLFTKFKGNTRMNMEVLGTIFNHQNV